MTEKWWIAEAILAVSVGAIGVAFAWASVKLGRWPWESRNDE